MSFFQNWLFYFLAAFGAPLGSFAADVGLAANLTTIPAQPRDNAPVWIEVELTGQGSGLREGALEFELRGDGETQYHYRTHELAVAPGKQRFRFLMPQGGVAANAVQREWRLRFVEGERKWDLGVYPQAQQRSMAQAVAIAVARSAESATQQTTSAWQMLRLERLVPRGLASTTWQAFSTAPAFIDPADFPVDPLGYCAFDAVLLEGETLTRLKQKARTALAHWVHAGGSLAVIAPGAIGESEVDFLNALGRPDPHWKPVTLGENGRLQLAPDVVVVARADFGRLLFCAEKPDAEKLTDSAEWRRSTSVFWNLNGASLAKLSRESPFSLAEDQPMLDQKFERVASLLSSLLSKNARVIPRVWLWTVLVAFILAAVPGEWLLLGWLRRRRFTWILFPCTALLATWVMTKLARHYLGEETKRQSFIVSDLGADGRIVRESRFELTWPAASGDLTDEVRGDLVSTQPTVPGPPTWYASPTKPAPLRFHGQFPASFSTTQETQQWRPILRRMLSLSDRPDDSGVRWELCRPEIVTGPWSRELVERLAPGKNVDFEIHWKGKGRVSDGGPVEPAARQSIALAPGNSLRISTAPHGHFPPSDLPFVGPEFADQNQSFIVVFGREGDATRVWRRLYLH
jgi:hypothetical protein